MHRFYVPPEQSTSDPIFLTGSEAHHALRVLRLRRGDEVSVLDGAGTELSCVIQNYDRDKVELSVNRKESIPRKPYQITLLQALPKGKLMDSIVQKATELGASRIVPLLTDRVVGARLTPKEALRKTEKWRLVAIEAIKQCGSAWFPEIATPTTPYQFLERNEKFDLPLLASLQEPRKHPREYFQNVRPSQGPPPASLCIWIGPEGDFTSEETDLIRSKGALPISLGDLVLRTETAAIYCLSILNYEMQYAFRQTTSSIARTPPGLK